MAPLKFISQILPVISPLQPLFATYNTALYKHSKLLVPILASFTSNEFTATNYFSFVDDISKVILHILVSNLLCRVCGQSY